MSLFKKHTCPPREIIVNVNFDLQDIYEFDPNKKYVLKTQAGMPPNVLEETAKMIKKANLPITVIIHGAEIEEIK